jgi:hypothetical protein
MSGWSASAVARGPQDRRRRLHREAELGTRPLPTGSCRTRRRRGDMAPTVLIVQVLARLRCISHLARPTRPAAVPNVGCTCGSSGPGRHLPRCRPNRHHDANQGHVRPLTGLPEEPSTGSFAVSGQQARLPPTISSSAEPAESGSPPRAMAYDSFVMGAGGVPARPRRAGCGPLQCCHVPSRCRPCRLA